MACNIAYITEKNGAGAPIAPMMRKETQQHQPMKTRGFHAMQQTRQTAVGTFPGLRCAHPTSGSCSAGQGDTLHPTERVRTLYPYAPVLIHYVSFGSGAASTHNTHYAMSANENQSRTLHLPTLHNFCSLCDIINKPEKPLWRELRLLLVIYRRVI